MSRTDAHRPFKHTDYDRQRRAWAALARAGEIPWAMVGDVPGFPRNLPRSRVSTYFDRQANRRLRHRAKRDLAAGRDVPVMYSPR